MAQNRKAADVGADVYDYGFYPALKQAMDNGQGLSAFDREKQGAIVRDYYALREGLEAQVGVTREQALAVYARFVAEASTLSVEQLSHPAKIAGEPLSVVLTTSPSIIQSVSIAILPELWAIPNRADASIEVTLWERRATDMVVLERLKFSWVLTDARLSLVDVTSNGLPVIEIDTSNERLNQAYENLHPLYRDLSDDSFFEVQTQLISPDGEIIRFFATVDPVRLV